MFAVTCVGLSRKNWLASLDAHFSYPNKDSQLIKLNKEVMDEYKQPIVDEHVKCLSKESMGPAWRWLILRDADIEDKMVTIIQKGDRDIYHKIKAYEQAKTLDQIFADFSVDMELFLNFEKHYELSKEQHSIEFEQELDKMIEGKD